MIIGTHAVQHSRGAVLLATLWFAAALSMIAAQLFYLTSGHARTTGHAIATAQRTYLLDAGLSYAIALLRSGVEPQATPLRHSLVLSDARVLIEIANESGKIDLNTATPEAIDAMLTAARLPADQVVRQRDELLDWIDTDNRSRNGGSERVRYRVRGLRHTPANGPIETMAAIALVPGFGEREVAGLRRFGTIHRPRLPLDPTAIARPLSEQLSPGNGTQGVRTTLADTLSVTVGFADQPASMVAYLRRRADQFKLLAIERL